MTALYDLVSASTYYAEDVRNVDLISNINGIIPRISDTSRFFHLKIPKNHFAYPIFGKSHLP